MIRCLLLALATVALAACDTPDPLDPSNPFDPEFTRGRIPSPPSEIDVAETTPTSVTLTWTDNSSFEVGFDVVERVPVVGGQPREERIATLPPDTESYTVSGLRDVGVHEYFVRAVSEPNRATGSLDPVSASVRVRYPFVSQQTLAYASTIGALEAELSGDGETLFLPLPGGEWGRAQVSIFDVATGQRLTDVSVPVETWSVYGRRLASLPGRRVALVGQRFNEIAEVVSPTAFVLSRDGSVEAYPLQGGDDVFNCQPFSVSPAGSKVASICPGSTGEPTLYAWDLPAVPRSIVQTPALDGELVGLSDTYALVRSRGTLSAVELSSGSTLWTTPIAWGQSTSTKPMEGVQRTVITMWQFSSRVELYPVSVLDSDGSVVSTWTDPVSGFILDTDGSRVVYPIDSAQSIGGFEGVVAFVDRPEERRILSGIAGSPVAARLTERGVLVVGQTGWIHEWDFTRSWEVVPPDV